MRGFEAGRQLQPDSNLPVEGSWRVKWEAILKLLVEMMGRREKPNIFYEVGFGVFVKITL